MGKAAKPNKTKHRSKLPTEDGVRVRLMSSGTTALPHPSGKSVRRKGDHRQAMLSPFDVITNLAEIRRASASPAHKPSAEWNSFLVHTTQCWSTGLWYVGRPGLWKGKD